jgi:hypothetical protein
MTQIKYAQKDIRRAYYLEAKDPPLITDPAFKAWWNKVLYSSFAAGEVNMEMGADIFIGSFGESISVSDRPKYIGPYFYHGRASLPKLERKLSPLLSTQLSFSELEITINNCDGMYNKYLIAGMQYTPLYGCKVQLRVGLRDLINTYFPVFVGVVHTEGGVERQKDTITLRARDGFEALNTEVPLPKITVEEFINAPKDVIGKMIPLCLGDWSYGIDFVDSLVTASVDSNGLQQVVKTKSTSSVGGGTIGYFTGYDGVGGGKFIFGVGGNWEGTTFVCQNIEECLIKRGDNYLVVSFSPAPEILIGYLAVAIHGFIRASDGAVIPYTYSNGDVAMIKTKVGCIGNALFEDEDANPINLAKTFLVTCGRLSSGSDFAASWDALKEKAAPPQSNLKNGIKMRLWVGDEKTNVLEYALSILKQIRCDLYVDKQRKLALVTQHPEDVPQLDTMRHIEPYHTLEDTINPRTDRQNMMTSSSCTYSFTPLLNGTALQTPKLINTYSVSILGGETAKTVDFPNLYREADARYQLEETVRFFSAAMEEITLSVAWVHIDVELGEWITLSLDVGSLQFLRENGDMDRVPCQVRSISVDPSGGSLELKLLSLGNFKVPNYTPPFDSDNLSGYDRVIVQG